MVKDIPINQSETKSHLLPQGLSTPMTFIIEKAGLAKFKRQRMPDAFARLGIHNANDLIMHLPSRYEVYHPETSMTDLKSVGVNRIRGILTKVRYVPGFRGRKGRFEATLEDQDGVLKLLWFNAGYLRDKLHAGMQIRVHGEVKTYGSQLQMVNPKWEFVPEGDPLPVRGLVDIELKPIYPLSEPITNQEIARLIQSVLKLSISNIEDPLPVELIQKYDLLPLAIALEAIHVPGECRKRMTDNLESEATSKGQQQAPWQLTSESDKPEIVQQELANRARKRLAFNELYLLELGITMRRAYSDLVLQASPLKWNDAIDKHIRERFPFELTNAQNRVLEEVVTDLARTRPMNRLVQGDVGSGKTMIAIYALLLAVASGKQAALMAPTELLAEQHYLALEKLLKGSGVETLLLTGGATASGSKHRKVHLAKIQTGEVDLVVGTQAILGDKVKFKDLSVVVIDEQHRFGVLQRAEVRQKSVIEQNEQVQPKLYESQDHALSQLQEEPQKKNTLAVPENSSPHYLVMTATPIPRTLSLTVFGDLDISTIDELPPGRSPIHTRVVRQSDKDKVYTYLVERAQMGDQIYVVVPLVDEISESDRESENVEGTKLSSIETHQTFLEAYFDKDDIGVVHGRLKPQQRDEVMRRFREGELKVLLATTVIEVGVDVPKANLIVIENADRFGLAQLHQLRGRIGRGPSERPNVCALIADPTTDQGHERLEAIRLSTNGFDIAEKDLEIRGMGDFFGTKQHGLPPLRVARIPGQDLAILKDAKVEAEKTIKLDPSLKSPQNRMLRKLLEKTYGESLAIVDVG